MEAKTVRKLKGGSLAGTYLIVTPEKSYVRKQIDRTVEREYGFQRWYSQLKRLQRYDIMFPDLFCKVIDYGTENDGQLAFFDLEYYKDALNCQEYLMTCQDPDEINKIFNLIIRGMANLHSIHIPSFRNSMSLYIEEEIEQKIQDSLDDEDFAEYYSRDMVTFRGQDIPSFSSRYEQYKKTAIEIYDTPIESFTHGNITLENILYLPHEDRVIFIDPYEENVIDNKYNEYSQVLQSCNSHYEIYNDMSLTVQGRRHIGNIVCEVPYGIQEFNNLFNAFMTRSLTQNEIRIVKAFEISQFIRMLPFKIKGDKEKAFLFYCLASHLTNDFLEDPK